MGKKQSEPIDVDLVIWAFELEDQGFVVDRRLIIQRPEWPFVLRVVIDADTDERVLKLGIHGQGKKVFFVQKSIARGQEQIAQEIERLGNLTEEQIAQVYMAAHAGILSVLFPEGV
jgi:hypothetical protein